MSTTVTGTQNSIINRMIGAAMLNVATYEEVEADTTATGQAAIVVVLVAIAGAIGLIRVGGPGIILGPINAVVGWLIWSGVTYLVGTRVFNGTATWGELLRTLGFAQTPGLLNVLGFVPGLGALIRLVVGLWVLVAGVIAIRQALDIDTGKAVLTAILSFIAVIVITALLATVFGVSAAAFRM